MRKPKISARVIALSGLFTGFSVALLYLASAVPASYIGSVAAASLFAVAAVIEAGLAGGLFVFAGTAVLGFLFVPLKSAVLLYALFFGYYPVVKSLAERLKSRAGEWAVKLAVMNAALTVMLLVFRGVVFSSDLLSGSYPLIYLVFNICFVLYDLGVSRLIPLYQARISRYGRR